jgi:hypothetical protein
MQKLAEGIELWTGKRHPAGAKFAFDRSLGLKVERECVSPRHLISLFREEMAQMDTRENGENLNRDGVAGRDGSLRFGHQQMPLQSDQHTPGTQVAFHTGRQDLSHTQRDRSFHRDGSDTSTD